MLKYSVIYAAFDTECKFSQEEIDNEEGGWGVSFSGKTPSEDQFLLCEDRENAIEIKKKLTEYTESFWKLFSAIKSDHYAGYDNTYESYYKMTWHPD